MPLGVKRTKSYTPIRLLLCSSVKFRTHFIYLLYVLLKLPYTVIGTARVVSAAGSMRLSGVRPSVRLSVCLSSSAGDIDRLLHGAQWRGVRRANAGSATLSAYVVAEHRLDLYY